MNLSVSAHELCARKPVDAWAFPLMSIASLGVLSFLLLIELIAQLKLDRELTDLVVFLAGSLLLPPICASLQLLISKRTPHSAHPELAPVWIASLLLCLFAALPVVAGIFHGGPRFLIAGMQTLLACEIGMIAVLMILKLTHIYDVHSMRFASTGNAVTLFICSASIAFASLFWIQPDQSPTNPIIRFFVATPFAGHGSPLNAKAAISLATLILFLIAVLVFLETHWRQQKKHILEPLCKATLSFTIALIWICYFDFSLPSDALHFLTNMAPALHLRFGGVLMVDTFSQYGPGPILMTLLGFSIGPTTFGVSNLTVQIHNLAFYSIWLICLYRMSTLKLPAICGGFLAIGVLLAVWGEGTSNINFAPSIMGFRYLPILLMVFSISLLTPPSRHSTLTVASTAIASFWGMEAAVGALGIHIAFLGMLGLRDRTIARMLVDIIMACLPALATIALMMTFTLYTAGTLPNYPIYLDYLSVYSMLSPYWSLPANPLFIGWGTILLAVFLVLAEGWLRILDRPSTIIDICEATLYYKFVPMALLTILMCSYFVGRSVEYTLVLALLPFLAIAIPGILYAASLATTQVKPGLLLMLMLPAVATVWTLSFSILALLRHDSPYSFVVQQCRDFGRCTPSTLLTGLAKKLGEQPVIERTGNRWNDNYFDESGAIREAVDAIKALAPDAKTLAVFLGAVKNVPLVGNVRDQIASDTALMYAGKWHRWPRSYGFSDELVPTLVDQIVDAPVHLHQGEIVIIRRDESSFGPIENGILRRIRAQFHLCPQPGQWKQIAVYRISDKESCSGLSTH